MFSFARIVACAAVQLRSIYVQRNKQKKWNLISSGTLWKGFAGSHGTKSKYRILVQSPSSLNRTSTFHFKFLEQIIQAHFSKLTMRRLLGNSIIFHSRRVPVHCRKGFLTKYTRRVRTWETFRVSEETFGEFSRKFKSLVRMHLPDACRTFHNKLLRI